MIAHVDGRTWLNLTQVARVLGVTVRRAAAAIPPVRVVAGRRWYAPEGLETLRTRLALGGERELTTQAYHRAVAYDQGVVVP